MATIWINIEKRLIGPLIIRRQVEPNGQLYDTERILMVSDWYNVVARRKLSSWYLSTNNPDGIEPIPDAVVVNGKFSQSLFVTTSNATRIRFRIINAAAFSMFTVSIDGLPLHIIELDQTAVVSCTVSSFSINAAQRVSFYVNLNEFNDTFVPPDLLPIKSVYIRFRADVEMYPVDIRNYIAPYATQYLPYPIFCNPLYLATLSFAPSDYPQAEQLHSTSYLKRDVVSVPASGWAKIRFLVNNPGVWLLNCQIDCHMDAGLILALIVGPKQLVAQGYTVTVNQLSFC
ncbi:unnamed protein product [Rotaria magnacalcarata]|uniref:Uncharacterized protein n=1 Tax=Rotaria magnacalcarata TaxID=392030 RepID=A0A819YPD2_9BILA|nr:unnamed protein product [Rotaria magnacalcarata]CAF4161408.1 unnamed protein product [Rotaria magnacalcarata]